MDPALLVAVVGGVGQAAAAVLGLVRASRINALEHQMILGKHQLLLDAQRRLSSLEQGERREEVA